MPRPILLLLIGNESSNESIVSKGPGPLYELCTTTSSESDSDDDEQSLFLPIDDEELQEEASCSRPAAVNPRSCVPAAGTAFRPGTGDSSNIETQDDKPWMQPDPWILLLLLQLLSSKAKAIDIGTIGVT